MTADDLRTRAREAAEWLYPEPQHDSLTYPRGSVRGYMRVAFTKGALWHATQQPTRDDISDAIEHSGIAIGTTDAEMAADAVLALFDGADRAAHDREVKVKAAALREAADEVAREHRSHNGFRCACTRHLIEVTEQAVRANVAAEIRAARTQVPTGDVAGQFEAAALGLAATIAEGKQP